MTRAAGGSSVTSVIDSHPEWEPWLALFRVARATMADPVWANAVPAVPTRADANEPLIAHTRVEIDARRATRLVAEIWRSAGLPRLTERRTPAVLEAAICEDVRRLSELAAEDGADAALYATAAALAVMPLLHACRDAWQDRIVAGWMRGSCPICGAWAALAEARGLERALRLRCGRCSADWATEVVRCPFCGTVDHERLGTLVGEGAGDTRKVDTCSVCRGYIKTVATLAAFPAADVRIVDLATVDLDVAALERGFARPKHAAHTFGVEVVPRAARGAWWRR
jgi:FdhE protein